VAIGAADTGVTIVGITVRIRDIAVGMVDSGSGA